MAKVPMGFRQIHLDFHTSPHIPNVANDFDPEKYARMMKNANVDSVTVFAKCHHGHMYINTDHVSRHPHLPKGMDLTKLQVDALHAEGLRAPVYISAQVDEFAADNNPGWVAINADGTPSRNNGVLGAGWWTMDMSSPYLQYLQEQTRLVLENFDTIDGIFFDMCWNQPTVSAYAKKGMLAMRLDPLVEADRNTYAMHVASRYMKLLHDQVKKAHPESGVYFNSRPLSLLPHDLNYMTHVEIEGLPTGGWGYMYFPMNVRYVRNFKTPYLGMTARFHRTWGDFGGMKPEPALKFEVSQFIAHGAKCSIGDQMHPRGTLDKAAYDMIGRVYGYVKDCQPWCEGATAAVNTAVLSGTAQGYHAPVGGVREGFTRMLSQLRSQFNIIDPDMDFAKYKLLIIPEGTNIDAKLAKRLDAFVAKGGAVLVAGASGMSPVADKAGTYEVAWKHMPVTGPVSDSPFTTTFFRAMVDIPGAPATDNVLYGRGLRVKADKSAKVLARVVDPYFERTWEHYCSHVQTPPDKLTPYAAAIVKGRVAYVPYPIFSLFGQWANLSDRALVAACIREICPEPVVQADGPSGLEVSVMTKDNMTVVHLLYASAERRCPSLDIVEDVVELHNVKVSLAVKRHPSRVYLAPSRQPLEYTYADGRVNFTVPTVAIHQMVAVE